MKCRALPICLFLFAGWRLAVGASAVQAPRAGAVRLADGSVYPILGVPGAYVRGPKIAGGTIGSAFADNSGILAVADGLQIVDTTGAAVSRFDCDSTGAVLHAGNENSADAWLPGGNTIITFAAGAWHSTALTANLPGAVLDLRRVSKDTVHILVSEQGAVAELTVGLASGNLLMERTLAGVKAPAVYTGDGILFSDGESLVYQTPSGARTQHFPGQVSSFEQISATGARLSEQGAATQWVVETASAHGLSMSQLPALPTTVAGGAQ